MVLEIERSGESNQMWFLSGLIYCVAEFAFIGVKKKPEHMSRLTYEKVNSYQRFFLAR